VADDIQRAFLVQCIQVHKFGTLQASHRAREHSRTDETELLGTGDQDSNAGIGGGLGRSEGGDQACAVVSGAEGFAREPSPAREDSGCRCDGGSDGQPDRRYGAQKPQQ
jgi:hypothetical protein